MEFDIFVVDAFTDQQFKGNSAAVVPVSEWPAESLMQNIAAENNLSETAYIQLVEELTPAKQCYQIRWFSPLTEIDFCGHATLASAKVLFDQNPALQQIEFVTQQVGRLTVAKGDNDTIVMSFPQRVPQAVDQVPTALTNGLSSPPMEVLLSEQAYFAVFATAEEVEKIQYDSEQLKKLAPYDVVVTAKGEGDFDFVSRYFWPANGGDEDPVTGSIHAGLAPYWSQKLDKQRLIAHQASKRGGVLHCELAGDRVIISGNAVVFMQGKISIKL